MVKVMSKSFSSKRMFLKKLKGVKIVESDIECGIDELFAWYGIPESINLCKKIDIINLKLNNNIDDRQLKTYLKKSLNTFEIKRFLSYIEYKSNNPKDVSSENYFKLVYGKGWENYKDKKAKDRKSPYDLEYVAKSNNISTDKAKCKISKMKSDKATNLVGFIRRHGKENGEKMFQKFQLTSKHTLEKYINKHGSIIGLEKWNKYLLVKSETSAFNKNFWINKGFTKKESIAKVRKISDNSSLKYFINKHNGNIDVAKTEFIKFIRKKGVNFNNASKESLTYFNSLYKKLIEFGIYDCDIHLGAFGKNELCLFYEDGCYLYDFAIKSHKLIIEYHGERWHPNPDRLSDKEWNSWKCIASGISANEKHLRDRHKEKVVYDNGFKLLEIWSNDTYKLNCYKINNFLEENNIKINK